MTVTLTQDIDALRLLDQARNSLVKVHRAGVRVLLSALQDDTVTQAPWWQSRDELEQALLYLATKSAPDVQRSTALSILPQITLERIRIWENDARGETVASSGGTAILAGPLPILTAARAMQALVASREHAFSVPTMLCYYWIVRELYTIEVPTWSSGGARGAAGGECTAFITGECLRSIHSFARAIQRTSAYLYGLQELATNNRDLRSLHERLKAGETWVEEEVKRLALDQEIEILLKRRDTTLHLDHWEETASTHGAKQQPSAWRERLEKEISADCLNFQHAAETIREHRSQEIRKYGRTARGRREVAKTETAHRIALQAVEAAAREATKALGNLQRKRKEGEYAFLARVAKQFEYIAAGVRSIGRPAVRFVESVLDRELARAAENRRLGIDASELVFAATAFGYATNWTPDRRLQKAFDILSELLSERITMPALTPIRVTRNGYQVFPIGFEIIRSYAPLAERSSTPIPPQVINNIVEFFERTAIRRQDELGRSVPIGWDLESSPLPRQRSLWVSALAVLALGRMVRLLDVRVNERVLSHFRVRRFDKLERSALTLDELMLCDHAMRFLPKRVQKDLGLSVSSAPALELMKAHAAGVVLDDSLLKSLRIRNSDKCFSVILFGPPGTGKTTFIEVMASAARVPLVEISPSDLLMDGSEMMERRATTCFEALSMLRGAAIIFDEFEVILETRHGRGERSMFTSLLYGMLPKLGNLYRAAKVGKIVYCLATNGYEYLDSAAVRENRFDLKLSVYPPDLLSRLGALLKNLTNKRCTLPSDDAILDRRIMAILRGSQGNTADEFAKHSLRGLEDSASLISRVLSGELTVDAFENQYTEGPSTGGEAVDTEEHRRSRDVKLEKALVELQARLRRAETAALVEPTVERCVEVYIREISSPTGRREATDSVKG